MTEQGLTGAEAAARLKQYGPNEIAEEKPNPLKKFLKWFASPIALMLLAAALLSLFIGKAFDFYFIIALMALNFGVGFWQENKADTAIQKLKESISVKVKVLRDRQWQWIESKLVVPDDILELMVGDVVPADVKILEAANLTVNESVLTGESLPKEKAVNDVCYSSSFITTGRALAKVVSTGKNTYFGKTMFLIEKAQRRSLLEKDILLISRFLMALSLIAVIFLTIFFLLENLPIGDLVILDLSLIIAGIPISLPTVMTLIISLGALELAKKHVVVRRLSALEDLANVNLLLTDKTGTLTKNQIRVDRVISYAPFNDSDVVWFASFSAAQDERSPINRAIVQRSKQEELHKRFELIEFTPADSERKRATTLVKVNGEKLLVSIGAPQVIRELCQLDEKSEAKLDRDIQEAARLGYRTLAVAVNKKVTIEKRMSLGGLLLLSDPLDDEAAEVINFMKANGIEVKMLTGDNRAISQRVANELGMQGEVVEREKINWTDESPSLFQKTAAFAEILPDDKYKLVQAAKKNYIVAVTGDGINDLPPIKVADAGIAVSNALDALKGAADIVLLTPGIAVVKDAVIEARKIFARLYSYSVYRISESFRIILTVLVLGLVFLNYPLTPLQLILLALMNDIPIVSLAFNRVKIASSPAKINVKERFVLSTIFGLVGIANSLLMVVILVYWLHLDWSSIQTVYFLKLTVSGHLLIYVAHTSERWFKFLPSREVILATMLTQLTASAFAIVGLFMAQIPISLVVFVWIWSFFWMQIAELGKSVQQQWTKSNRNVS